MSPALETVFLAATLFVLPFWLLMIVLPTWRFTRRVMGSGVVVALLPALYVVLILPRLGEVLSLLAGIARSEAEAVRGLFRGDEAAVIAWIHFLAFDLFVGRYIYLDARERELSRWLTAPILVLTFLLGPAGLLTYLVLRAALGAKRRRRMRSVTPPAPAS